ncbi:SMP-30/gluconolactonase/LRE family protein [Paraconexibacter sp.]|uniref:SMP-30/gluconolactonase/LRE family protein n=1 Tax=Paraconexibacter sp. TaxID=2949640 RepID=UPI0035687C81
MRRVAIVGATVLVAVATAAAPAGAITACPGVDPSVTPVLTGEGSLESVIVDARGRLYYTDTTAQALKRLDAPGAHPEVVAAGIASPGGLAIDDQGRILLGQGNSAAGGALGNLAPSARLLRIDPETGEVTTVASGLQMTNGVVRAADGAVYASNDIGLGIDRIGADGSVALRWARVTSPNGLAIDRAQRYLYAAQTFQPAAIARIDLEDPSAVETYATPAADGIAGGPDGMAIDGRDRLVVAANAGGEVWRVDTDRTICSVGRGLTTPSAVAYGHSDRGFSAGRLFSVGFDGVVAEIPGGRVLGADLAPVPADAAAPTGTTQGPGVFRVLFAPVRARVRGGTVRLSPKVTLVRPDGERVRLVRRVRLGAARTRTGRPTRLRVRAGQRSITARFTVRGLVRTRRVTLVR